MAMVQAYQSIAQSQNEYRSSLQAAGVGLLLKIVITGGLTKQFGTIGASLSTLLGLIVALFILHFHVIVRQENMGVNVTLYETLCFV